MSVSSNNLPPWNNLPESTHKQTMNGFKGGCLPENWWLGDDPFLLGRPMMLVLGMEYMNIICMIVIELRAIFLHHHLLVLCFPSLFLFGSKRDSQTNNHQPLLGGSSQSIINHNDRRSPKSGFFPFQMALFWLTNGGDPNHLLHRMLFQVAGLRMRWIN